MPFQTVNKKNTPPFKVEREGSDKILVIDYTKSPFYPSIEDNDFCMADVMNLLIEVGEITTLTLSEERNYVYPYEQVKLLNQLRNVYVELIKDKNILELPKATNAIEEEIYGKALINLRFILLETLKRDPIK